MTQFERAQFYGSRNTMCEQYHQLASFLTNRLKDIHAGELVLPKGLSDLYGKELVKRYGSPTKKGRLQHELDRKFNGILQDLKRDFPYFTGQQIQVFSYIAARLPYYLVARLSGLSSVNSVWIMKTKMRDIIKTSACSRREEYLMLLGMERK